MQQLSLNQLCESMVYHDDYIILSLPLPTTLARARHLSQNIASLLDADLDNEYIGADRFQISVIHPSYEMHLCVEWLCESVWLAPVSASSDTLKTFKARYDTSVHR